VLKERCIGTGACVENLPRIFAFDNDGLSAESQDQSSLTDDEAQDIIQNCPVAAIVDVGE
jgi:ferredoxin